MTRRDVFRRLVGGVIAAKILPTASRRASMREVYNRCSNQSSFDQMAATLEAMKAQMMRDLDRDMFSTWSESQKVAAGLEEWIARTPENPFETTFLFEELGQGFEMK